jgi:hypothetical protein
MPKRKPVDEIRARTQECVEKHAKGHKGEGLPNVDSVRQAVVYLLLKGIKGVHIASALGTSTPYVSVIKSQLKKAADLPVKKKPYVRGDEEIEQTAVYAERFAEPAAKPTEPIDIDETDAFLLAVADGPPPAGFRVARSQWDKLGVYTKQCFEPKGYGPVDDHLADYVISTPETDKPAGRG